MIDMRTAVTTNDVTHTPTSLTVKCIAIVAQGEFLVWQGGIKFLARELDGELDFVGLFFISTAAGENGLE